MFENYMWNHNSHFHNYLLSQLPLKMDRTLDVGCGLGIFTSRLAERSSIVDAIDLDEAIIKEASEQHNLPNVFYQCADFIETDLPQNSYDTIVSIASLHHMDAEAALNKMKSLLRPSGKLFIIGLYRETTILDYTYSLISVPINYIYLKLNRSTVSISKLEASIRPAQLSFRQIKSTADSIIPSYKIKRRLFWRYSLIWQKS